LTFQLKELVQLIHHHAAFDIDVVLVRDVTTVIDCRIWYDNDKWSMEVDMSNGSFKG
jgi:hypothetical protein